MNESQNNFNEELNTNVDNSVDTSINDIPAPTQPKAPFTAEESVRPSIDDPIKPVINEPVTPAATSSIDNGNKKGNKGLIIIIIVLVALLLGAVGYIAYSNGWFGEKETEPTSKETEKEEVKEQVINFDYSKYKADAPATAELGKVKIKGKEYTLNFERVKCTPTSEIYSDCEGYGEGYFNIIKINNVTKVVTEYGIDTIGVLDDRYLYIDSGENQYSSGTPTGNVIILDSDSFFEDTRNIKDSVLNYPGTFRYYEKIENGSVVEGSGVTREVGYIDKNTFKYATCDRSTTIERAQVYKEYIVTIKDGKVSKKEDFSIDGVFCSSQY